MKFQCSCGAKYEVDIMPGMGRLTFVCQNCKQDYSDYINDLIRNQLAGTGVPSRPAITTAPVSAAPQISIPPAAVAATPPPPADAGVPRLKISRGHEEAAPQQPQEEASKYCSRHRTELTVEHCQVCHK